MINIIISVVILLIAFVFQVKFFSQTQRSRKTLKNIFPSFPETDLKAEDDEETGSVQIKCEEGKDFSYTFRQILFAINNYLGKNKGAADYATLKDITDRQCDAIEEQIDATAPVPIYFGLCGTLIGIVLGVSVLGFGGGIDSLLGKANVDYTVSTLPELGQYRDAAPGQKAQVTEEGNTYVLSEANQWVIQEDKGSQGIRDLLCGVAVAMLTTFFGVLFTIIGSATYKESSKENERKKNLFLNWMQGELLPQMKHNMASTLNILQKNLNKFNKDFSDNSRQLNAIFANINTTYQGQAEVLKLIEKMDVNNIATANVKVLKELQACTDQIGNLKEFLLQSSRYLTSVESLNGNLNDHLERTKLIENMGKFFKDEIEQIEIRKAAISKAVVDIDSEVHKSFEALSTHTEEQHNALTKAATNQQASLLKAIDAQQTALNEKLQETHKIVDDLQSLVDIKDSLGKMSENAAAQNEKMDKILSMEESLKALVNSSNSQSSQLSTLADLFRKMPAKQQPQSASAEAGEFKVMNERVVYHENEPSREKFKIPVVAWVTGGITCASVIASCILYMLKVFEVL